VYDGLYAFNIMYACQTLFCPLAYASDIYSRTVNIFYYKTNIYFASLDAIQILYPFSHIPKEKLFPSIRASAKIYEGQSRNPI